MSETEEKTIQHLANYASKQLVEAVENIRAVAGDDFAMSIALFNAVDLMVFNGASREQVLESAGIAFDDIQKKRAEAKSEKS